MVPGMMARGLVATILVTVMAACAATPTVGITTPGTSPVAAVPLRTMAPSSPEACPMARTEGTLVRHQQSGAGLRDPAGAVWQVIWPTDYTARDEVGRITVYDGGGNLIAHEGDRVEIGGQDVGGGTWLGCAGMRPIAEPSPTASPPQAGSWGPLAVVPPQDGADTARIEGNLRITESCVFLEEQGRPVLLTWPADRATWDATARTITFVDVDGTSISVEDGASVTVGGSGDDSEESGVTPEVWLAGVPWVARPAAGCPVDPHWAVGAVTVN